jgi:hypothetical protein
MKYELLHGEQRKELRNHTSRVEIKGIISTSYFEHKLLARTN